MPLPKLRIPSRGGLSEAPPPSWKMLASLCVRKEEEREKRCQQKATTAKERAEEGGKHQEINHGLTSFVNQFYQQFLPC